MMKMHSDDVAKTIENLGKSERAGRKIVSIDLSGGRRFRHDGSFGEDAGWRLLKYSAKTKQRHYHAAVVQIRIHCCCWTDGWFAGGSRPAH